jgi:1,4-alpha-glucan branching enzyme
VVARNGKSTEGARKRVTFKLDRDAGEVRLVGSFNDWDPDARILKRSHSGVWTTWMMLEAGRYEYRYVVDGEWTNDPDAERCTNPFGGENCLQIVT